MDPGLDHPLHVGVGEGAVVPRREDRHARHVHVHGGALQVEEARVQAREAFRGHRRHPTVPPDGRVRWCYRPRDADVAPELRLAADRPDRPPRGSRRSRWRSADDYGATVSTIDNIYDPDVVRIQPGQSIEWTNDGRSPHTVTADDGSWDSGNMDPGAALHAHVRSAGHLLLLLPLSREPRGGDGGHGGRG